MQQYDVVVVGAGPAGSSAARAAATSGVSVLLLDRAEHPRYKTCGGGLIGPTLAELPAAPPVRAEVTRVSMSLRGGAHQVRASPDGRPVLLTASRAELDLALTEAAAAAGAEVRTGPGAAVTGPPVAAAHPDHPGGPGGEVVVPVASGPVRARVVVAADGTGSRTARDVGVRLASVDLGLELELGLAGQPGLTREWADRVHLDWGPLPGSYGWVFPKLDSLTVGVIAAKGRPDDTRAYLRALVATHGLDDLPVLHESGHLTRCRTPDSPLGRGRVLLAGDAAGLLEPWTREGISFAVRSGALAGRVAAAGTDLRDGSLQSAYRAAVNAELAAEMRAGAACLRAFESHPGAFHRLLGSVGWGQFVRLCRGETTLARAWDRWPVRAGVRVLAAGGRRG